MPFAGHPNVGTGWVLAGLGRDRDGMLRFEEIAGLVEVKVERDGRKQTRAVTIAAPQPLSLGAEMPVDLLAGCIGLRRERHRRRRRIDRSSPRSATPSCIAEVAGRRPVACRCPTFGRFQVGGRVVHRRSAPTACRFTSTRVTGSARTDPPAGPDVLAALRHDQRMPATGSAATPLAALLLSLTGDSERRYEIRQGVEMGRPSLLACTARRGADGIRASVGGGCVPVLKGEVSL